MNNNEINLMSNNEIKSKVSIRTNFFGNKIIDKVNGY